MFNFPQACRAVIYRSPIAGPARAMLRPIYDLKTFSRPDARPGNSFTGTAKNRDRRKSAG
jgi:hypothetical protein